MHQHQSIGERLKGFRRQMGWTQQQLHVESRYRLRLRTIQRIESGKGRVSEKIQKIVDSVLGCDFDNPTE